MREITNILTEDTIEQVFRKHQYITDRSIVTALRLVQGLNKPLLIEGPAGVGKTQVAKVLAEVLETPLIRLQCYEGLDVHNALYEWNYQKQLLHIQLTEKTDASVSEREQEIFGPDFLLRRPLLEALSAEEAPPVLLIDEIDRADEEFEAFLLELLAEFQITIPEIGTILPKYKPYVILTSNRTRELSDALRRRCLYQWFPYPDIKKETAIIQAHLPEINETAAEKIAAVIMKIRSMPLNKVPGVAETLDWAEALMLMHKNEITAEAMKETLGCLAKDREDWNIIENHLQDGGLLSEKYLKSAGAKEA